MKKCARCGLLNDVIVETCGSCGFTAFEEKPAPARPHEPGAQPARAGVTVERHGDMVRLKCRTPAEACLVRESLESAGVIALLPDEDEMGLEYSRKGYVEVEIPAAAYDSAGDIRSVVEFSAPPPPPRGIGIAKIIVAIFLGVAICPGVLIFLGLRANYKKHGEEKKSKELTLAFLIGATVWLIAVIFSFASK